MIDRPTPEQCQIMIKALSGQREAFKHLLENQPHLAAGVNALRGDRQAFNWLMKNRYIVIAMFCLACEGDAQAIRYLEQYQGDFLYPFCLACLGRPEGQFWIRRLDNPDWFALASAIAETVKLVTKDKVFWYSSFW